MKPFRTGVFGLVACCFVLAAVCVSRSSIRDLAEDEMRQLIGGDPCGTTKGNQTGQSCPLKANVVCSTLCDPCPAAGKNVLACNTSTCWYCKGASYKDCVTAAGKTCNAQGGAATCGFQYGAICQIDALTGLCTCPPFSSLGDLSSACPRKDCI